MNRGPSLEMWTSPLLPCPHGDLYRRPPSCCLKGQELDSLWSLGGSASALEKQPSSPGNLCNMKVKNLSTDQVEWVSRTRPQPVRELSVVSIPRQQEVPSTGCKNQGFFHITRHLHITLMMQNGLPLVLSYQCKRLYTTGQKKSCLMQLPWAQQVLELFHSDSLA